ncbi:MAG: metabolite traffic protein EboE [Lentisphaeria bacterium]|nr:metabolite traffic protein EboE [Lentisphaeria bacterium]NQZ66763.1 metabolite traffic protein EboE [Lentisphaeria bacterium]
MKLRNSHLAYCQNVHKSASLDDVLNNIRNYTVPIRQQINSSDAFGLGLWFPHSCIDELKNSADALTELCAKENMYLFTINGFPYGPFHELSVKEKVYTPDWGDDARLDYTKSLMDILVQCLPDGIEGSISTVPVTYQKRQPENAIANLLSVARYAAELEAQFGKTIKIALEPEPDCFLENTEESIAFFKKLKRVDSQLTKYLGICYDTCHLSLQNENLADAYEKLKDAGIDVPKIQISAAIDLNNTGTEAKHFLTAYDEPVYLHQTRIYVGDICIANYPDLGPALEANLNGRWLVHFHVPLPFEGNDEMRSTSHYITDKFLDLIFEHSPNIEIETYTFDVLPDPKPELIDSICSEYKWVMERL